MTITRNQHKAKKISLNTQLGYIRLDLSNILFIHFGAFRYWCECLQILLHIKF